MCKKKPRPDWRWLRACLLEMTKTGGQTNERSREKVRKWIVWPRKVQNVAVDNDVVEVVSVSSDSDVVPGFPSPDSPDPDIPLTDTECMCFPYGPQRFASQMEESFRYERRTQITPKDGKNMLQSQGRSPLVRGSGMSASERMMEPCSLAGGPKWTKRPGTGLCVVEGFGRYSRISQPNMRYISGRGQIQVGLIFGRDGYASCAFTRRRRTTHFLGNRVNKRRERLKNASFHWDTYRGWIYRSSQAGRRKGGN